MRLPVALLVVAVAACSFHLPSGVATEDGAAPGSDASGTVTPPLDAAPPSPVDAPPVDVPPADAPEEGDHCQNGINLNFVRLAIECNRENNLVTCTCRRNGLFVKICSTTSQQPCATPNCCGF